MALPAGLVWEHRPGGSNDNGGGFNAARGGTDYTLQDAAQLTCTDLAMTAGGTTLTSATGGFTDAMKGNLIYIKSGTNFVAGWYEIVSVADTNTVTIDRDATSGGNGSSGTGSVGGARAELVDEQLEAAAAVAGNTFWIKAGTYTLTAPISVSTTGGSSDKPQRIIGYQTNRGDRPTEDDRPLLACGANGITLTWAYWQLYNLRFTSTASPAISLASGTIVENCRCVNSSESANRAAFGGGEIYHDVEAVSTLGRGIARYAANLRCVRCWYHDSAVGVDGNNNQFHLWQCVFTDCTTGLKLYNAGISHIVDGCTVDGCGTGMCLDCRLSLITNNLITGCTTGISATAEYNNVFRNNNLYDNTTDRSNVTADDTDTAVDPAYDTDTLQPTAAAVLDGGFGIRLGVG